jgi:hypothetical protein
MTDPKIDPEDEMNQQRKAVNEDLQRDDSVIGAVENAADVIVRPFTRDRLTEEEIAEQRAETDAEERPS